VHTKLKVRRWGKGVPTATTDSTKIRSEMVDVFRNGETSNSGEA